MKRLKSIYYRNFITNAIVIIMCFSVMGAVFAAVSYRFFISKEKEEISQSADYTTRMILATGREWGFDGLELRATLSWLSDITDFDIVVTDVEGEIISCSDKVIDCPHMGKKLPATTLNIIDKSGDYYGITTLGGIYGAKRHVVGVPLISSGKLGSELQGYVFLTENTSDMAGMWSDFAGKFVFIVLIVLLIAFLISYLMTRKQARPIKEMAEAAQHFGRGDFSIRITDNGRCNEIAELADSLNTMADSLERSEKTRRELIANVSHELKTPMTTITGFADGILDGTIPQEKYNEYIGVISSEAKRLSRLVRGMLDMSQLQSVKKDQLLKKSFDVSEVIRLALVSLEAKITNRGLDVALTLPEEPVEVLGDMDAITQVVYNLIDNAAKFAEKESIIRIELWKQEGKAYVSVANKGEEISKEELPLIFDRFHKTDKSRSMDREGVGLGLYIVKTILDNHGEDIFVTSNNGETKFVFTLTRKV